MSAQFLVFFLLCDSLIRSKSAQHNVVCIKLEEEAEIDWDYGRERDDGFKLQVEECAEKVFGQELVSL